MSGCIVGDCAYCDWPVDESDWDDDIIITDSVFVHEWCARSYRKCKRKNEVIKNIEFEHKIMCELIHKHGLDKELENLKFYHSNDSKITVDKLDMS